MSLPRILAQVVMTGVSVVSKAFMEAYARAAADPSKLNDPVKKTARAMMSVSEARGILNLAESATPPARADIIEQFTTYYAANDEEHGNSRYLQAKVYNAKEALLEEYYPEEDASDHEGEEGQDGGDAKSDAGEMEDETSRRRPAE